MRKVGISEISRNPAILNGEEILEIVDKKSKRSKYIAIPSDYREKLKGLIEEIEYARWLESNREALQANHRYVQELENSEARSLEKL